MMETLTVNQVEKFRLIYSLFFVETFRNIPMMMKRSRIVVQKNSLEIMERLNLWRNLILKLLYFM